MCLSYLVRGAATHPTRATPGRRPRCKSPPQISASWRPKSQVDAQNCKSATKIEVGAHRCALQIDDSRDFWNPDLPQSCMDVPCLDAGIFSCAANSAHNCPVRYFSPPTSRLGRIHQRRIYYCNSLPLSDRIPAISRASWPPLVTLKSAPSSLSSSYVHNGNYRDFREAMG
jgi:hypothetical protein